VLFVKNKYIEMVWEKVTYDSGCFTTVFMFSNSSAITQDVKIGFPINTQWEIMQDDLSTRPIEEQVTNKLDFVTNSLAFKSFINGEFFYRKVLLITNTKGETKDYDVVYIGDVKFLPSQSLIVSNSYFQKPNKTIMSDGCEYNKLHYILKTGSTWKKPIKKSEIQIKIPYIADPFISNKQAIYSFTQSYKIFPLKYFIKIHPFPKNITVAGDGYLLKWDYKNFIPIQDIYIQWGWSEFFSSKGLSIPEIFFPADKQLKEDYGWGFCNEISKMVHSENDKEFFLNHKMLVKELQDKERFYDFIIALGFGIINQYEHTKETGIFWINDSESSMRFVVNGIHAVNGYKFKTKFWQNFFKHFSWYAPKNDEYGFSPQEEAFIKKVMESSEKLEKLRNQDKF